MDISSVLEESHEIGIYTNYFFDLYRDVFISKKNEEEETFKNNERILLIIGYNLVKNISIKQNPESILAKVFSNLSNEKTLKILKFLDNNESERREISDRLGMTMDEINFAVGFLLSANIINIELGRKLTYQFSSKAFIEKISKILSDFFNK
jgi:DNA-binding transcriptional ArsR family regulator